MPVTTQHLIQIHGLYSEFRFPWRWICRLFETVQPGRLVTSHSQTHRERYTCYCLEFSFHKWIKFFRDESQWLVCIFMTPNDTMKRRQHALLKRPCQPARLPTVTIRIAIIWTIFKLYQCWCCMQVQKPNTARWSKEFLMHLNGSHNSLPVGPTVHILIPNPAAFQSSAVLVSTTENLGRNPIAKCNIERLPGRPWHTCKQTLKTKDRRVWSGFI
jgi:hypothetical protein